MGLRHSVVNCSLKTEIYGDEDAYDALSLRNISAKEPYN